MLARHGWVVVFAGLIWSPVIALAQPPAPKPAGAVSKTVLELELLTGTDGSALHAQEWRSVFETLDVPVQIRRSVLEEKPGVKERTVGTLRYVSVVGKLDRQGQVAFADRSFARSDAAKLKEWLDELKTYGVQGAPQGQPLWGLSKPQFEALYEALSEINETEFQDQPVQRAAAEMKLPASYPLRWSTAASERLQQLGAKAVVRQRVAGFTKATSLAVVLNDAGFGFRPNRTPNGSLELIVEPYRRERLELWPVGWPLQRQTGDALPGLFALTNIEWRQAPVLDVLDTATDLADVRVLVNYAEFEQRGVNLATLKISHPLKKTTWSLALRSMLVPQQIAREYWQDEAGRAFVWITPIGKERGQPEAPGK
jgi:hypothetical protein